MLTDAEYAFVHQMLISKTYPDGSIQNGVIKSICEKITNHRHAKPSIRDILPTPNLKDVYLVKVGDKKIGAIKMVRTMSHNLGLYEAKCLVENVSPGHPQYITSMDTKTFQLTSQLADAIGCQIELGL